MDELWASRLHIDCSQALTNSRSLNHKIATVTSYVIKVVAISGL